MNIIYRYIFNSSRSPWVRFWACGAIGSLVGFVMAIKNAEMRDQAEWFAIGGGVSGLLAGSVMYFVDFVRRQRQMSGRSPMTAKRRVLLWILIPISVIFLVWVIGLIVMLIQLR
jgi:hypothetical protein